MFTKMLVTLKAYVNEVQEEAGQGLVEYALIIVLVSIALITALGLLADDIDGTFTTIGDTLNP